MIRVVNLYNKLGTKVLEDKARIIFNYFQSNDKLSFQHDEIEIQLVNNEKIIDINKEFRHINEATDVISLNYLPTTIPHTIFNSKDLLNSLDFQDVPEEDEVNLKEIEDEFYQYFTINDNFNTTIHPSSITGQIYISLEYLKEKQEEEDILHYMIHGMCHLYGYKHHTSQQYKEMLYIENKMKQLCK